ncbi:MAG: hypothetical protein H8E13_08020 [Actinobacteria bacterium]|nr:hypothetical protein [Actinomycetota bacterium]
MPKLNSTERVINTFEGKSLDRLPIFDIIHNVDFIEYVSGEKLTKDNAEDITCKAISKTLDLVRHFRIPDFLDKREYEDEDGFKYREEWWTSQIAYIPIKTLSEAKDMMKRDIERIYKSIEAKKFCFQAREQCNLFGEYFEDPEELNISFERITKKLGNTMMIAPETVPGLYTATHRYGFQWIIYMFYDYPDIANAYYDALVDHELFKIDCFGPTKLSKVAMISEAVAFNTGLLWPMKFIKDIIFPRVKKCINRWKKYGYYVIYHGDGNKWEICKDIIDIGADSINPFEPLATMDIKKFRKLYPDTVCGSMIDCQDLLAFGTPEQIREATKKAIEDSGGAKTLVGSTSEIHPGIKLKNALAMYEVAINSSLQ